MNVELLPDNFFRNWLSLGHVDPVRSAVLSFIGYKQAKYIWFLSWMVTWPFQKTSLINWKRFWIDINCLIQLFPDSIDNHSEQVLFRRRRGPDSGIKMYISFVINIKSTFIDFGLFVGLLVCLYVCLYPINVKTAEPIGHTFVCIYSYDPRKLLSGRN